MMKIPMPPAIAFCKKTGIDLIICFLMLVTVIKTLIKPEINTIHRIAAGLKPKALDNRPAAKEFRPKPGAVA